MTPVKHFSYSSRETLLRCAKSWFLKYQTDAPRRPALWSAGGSAVHETTELWDRGHISDEEVADAWQDRFERQLQKLYAADPNQWNWGRSASEPIEVWRTQGLAFVQSYLDWRKRAPYEIWTTPDGQPAIELDVSGYLPGCPVEIKGFIDRIFYDPTFDQLVDVDLKTGKRPPKDAFQFGTYNALLQVKYGVTTAVAAPFMNRKNTLGKPYEMAEFTPEAVGAIYGEAWARIQSGEFPADGYDQACFICDVSAACAAKGGPLSAKYDPASPAYIPF